MTRFIVFGTLFRYFGAKYLLWISATCAGVTMTVSLIHAVELMRRVSNRNQNAEDFNVLNMVLLNIPAVIEMTIPITLIIGSMICFETWNRSNEFVVSRGFGRSIWAVLSPVAAVALLVGLFFIAIVNPIGSVTSRQYENAMNSVFGSEEQRLSVSADGIWLRDDHGASKFIIHGDMLDVEASNIINPIVYAFDPDNNLTLRITADSMQLTDKGWMADGARTWNAAGTMTEKGSLMLPSNLAALDLGLSSEPPNTIAIFSLPAFIKLLEKAGLPTVEHRIHFHRLLSMPLLMVGLAMLSARATLTNLVRGRRARLFTRGLAIAVGITLFSHFMQVLGGSLRLPVIVAGWAPAVTVTVIGAVLLARMDEA